MIQAMTYSVGSVSEAMTRVLTDLLFINPSPGPKDTSNEILGAQIHLRDPRRLFPYSTARKFNYAYTMAESIWNLTPTRETEVLRRYAGIVDKFVSDQGGDISYAKWAYGEQLNDQVRYALKLLRDDPSDRRAACAINTNLDRSPGTPPCLVSVHWQVRNGGLHQFINMRSNDAWLGLPLDLMQFGMWGHLMAAELRIPFVSYIHQASTLHLYTRDIGPAKLWLAGEHSDEVVNGPRDFGSGALTQVLDGYLYGMIKKRIGPRGSTNVGAEPLACFMLGDYERGLPALTRLRANGHGISWPQRGE